MGITSNKQCFLWRVLLFLFLFFNNAHFSYGGSTISAGQSLSGNQTISSPGGIFELGFFTPGNSQNYYIGIWYKNLPNQTVVWVANRKESVPDPSFAALKLFEDGNLVLLKQPNIAVWSTNSSSIVANSSSPIAMLLDNGNFVVRDASDESNVMWQSFDHPTDTWLPGGKIGHSKLTKEKQVLVPWRSLENPAPSLFSLEVEPNGTSHLLLWNGSKVYWTSGYWTGKIFSLVPEIQQNYFVTNFTYISNENESYFTYKAAFPSFLTRFVVDVTGQLNQLVWGKDYKIWQQFWIRPVQQCNVYALCGAFGVCNQQKVPLCVCMQGFESKSPKDWALSDHSAGCVRKTPLKCNDSSEDVFSVMSNVQLPENSVSLKAENIEECRLACLSNCSCVAFAYDESCLIWQGSLLNLQQLPSDAKMGSEFHLRIAASEQMVTRSKKNKKTIWIIVGAAAGSIVLCGIILVFVRRKQSAIAFEAVEGSLVLFKYRDLHTATKNFSQKLGEGGFGTVFKGILRDSTAIAVKALNKSIGQGEKQFRSEVRTIGTIQHKNLVRLRGFCAEASKRFLVYDYMPNGSLESLLFGQNSAVLDWKTRYNIAVGTAQGLAYLHEKCRECIIHCDIKPDNILLDAEYNPRVADFGLAKLIGREFSRVLTTIRGTRGYLAPEWISGEAVTPKADVFSYGMLLFEVISGRRNRDLSEDGADDYFPNRAANVMNKGEEVVALLDNRLESNADIEELTRACKVACWCIQDDEKDRPSMGQIVQILEGKSEIGTPPVPQFLKCLADNPVETMFYRETTSSSDLFA